MLLHDTVDFVVDFLDSLLLSVGLFERSLLRRCAEKWNSLLFVFSEGSVLLWRLGSSVGDSWILGDELVEFCKFLGDVNLMPDRHSFINKSNKQTVTFTLKIL